MSFRKKIHNVKINVQNLIFKNSFLYKKYLGGKINLDLDLLKNVQSNTVLKDKIEIDEYFNIIKSLGLPVRSDRTKNWDTLITYSEIVKNLNSDSVILDAGAEIYSMILPWLFLTGYKNLFGNNLVFSKKFKRGSIVYNYGDITNTDFPPKNFDAISCLSVIEHGVNIDKFFMEMQRILKPGGILILSTDYFQTKINTEGKFEYGSQIKIFCEKEIEALIHTADNYQFKITSKVELKSFEKPVRWERFDLDYTYICLTFQKIV